MSKEDLKKKISEKIEIGMKLKGWNQNEFAEKMNVQPSVVSKWLSGNNNFQVNTIFEIEDVLGIALIVLISQPTKQDKLKGEIMGCLPSEYIKDSILAGRIANDIIDVVKKYTDL